MSKYLSALCCFFLSTSLYAHEMQNFDCSDLEGTWISSDSTNIEMFITDPLPEFCGTNCTILTMSYSFSGVDNTSKIYCHEGQAGLKGQGPMIFSFEGAQKGHSIGTYNRQLNLLWAGVIPKDENKKWLPRMDSYWFTKK